MECIYCHATDSALFKKVEHVVPQGFGTFGSDTLVLKCVCDPCNEYFGKELDQPLARDSWEGLTRYRQGLRSREKRKHPRISLSLAEEEELGNFSGALLEDVDGTVGGLPMPKSQFWIFNKQKNRWDRFSFEEIKNFKMNDELYGEKGSRETRIISLKTRRQELIDELKKVGIDFVSKEDFYPEFAKTGNVVAVEGRVQVDHIIKRAYAKVIMNAVAWYTGETAILRPEWDRAREYIRYGKNPILARMIEEPFWGEETKNMRFESDAINILVGNHGGNVIGKIQFYNHFTYDFILIENHHLQEGEDFAIRFERGKAPIRGVKKTIQQS